MPPRITESQIDSLCEAYKSGMTHRQAASHARISQSATLKYLRQRGVVREQNAPDYSVNHSAFATITDQSAYWAGFILADGNITRRPQNQYRDWNPTITVMLSLQDWFQVQKFNDFISPGRPVSVCYPERAEVEKGRSAMARTVIYSKQIADDLESLWITEKKTHTARVHDSLKDNRHFWRGVVDGDGSLSFVAQKNTKYSVPYQRFNIVGTTDVCQKFYEWAKPFLPGCEAKIVKVNYCKSLYSLALGGKYAAKIASVLYDDCSLYLDRKKVIAEQFKHIRQRGRIL